MLMEWCSREDEINLKVESIIWVIFLKKWEEWKVMFKLIKDKSMDSLFKLIERKIKYMGLEVDRLLNMVVGFVEIFFLLV